MNVTRRNVLAAGGVAAMGTVIAARASGDQGTEFSDPKAAADWMAVAAGNAGRAAEGVLRISRFVEAIWFLTAPIGWTVNAGQANLLPSVRVPTGFVTDLASIPRVFWQVLPRDGEYAYAAIVHDYLYWVQICDRAVADQILKAAMIDFKVPGWQVTAIYESVSFGGGGAWESNRRAYEQGEHRILRAFPDDPTIRWDDWKVKSNVFAPEPAHGKS